jgi:hypothetical protein
MFSNVLTIHARSGDLNLFTASSSTDPTLTDILLGGLSSWLHQTESDQTEVPADYQSLVLLSKQSVIGWVQFFQGCITTSWQRMHEYHFSGMKPVKERDGASWSCNILSYIFTEWISLWEARSKAVHGKVIKQSIHGKDTSTRTQAKDAQALCELEILYSQCNHVLQQDGSFCLEII